MHSLGTFEESSKQPAVGVLPSDVHPAWSRLFPQILKSILFPPLAQLYRKLYFRTRDLRYLEASIQYALASLSTKPVGHPSLHHYQQRLADLLRDRYRRLQHERDLHLSIMLEKSALAAVSSTHPDITWHRGGLRTTYYLRYLHTSDLRYLEESISLAHLAVSELPPGSSTVADWQESLANSYHLRYTRFGGAEDLEKELEWSLAAVDSTSRVDPKLPSRLATLAIAYSDRYAYYRRLDDIDMGLFWSHSAVSKTSVKHPDYFTRQVNLAGLYSERYKLLGNTEDIERAIKLCLNSISGLSSNPSALIASYHNLAFYYKSRHSKLGTFTDLDLAIEYSLKAANGSLDTSPNFGLIAGQCGALFLERFQSQSKPEDLETATKWSEKSVVALKDMPGKAANYQYNYAMVLYVRYRRYRDRKDLDLAFRWCTSAIELTRKDSPDLAERQNLLTLLYLDFFRLSHNHDYLRLALNLQQEVVTKTPTDHPDAAVRYSNLAATYSMIYHHEGGLDNREAVMKWNHAAVDAASTDNPRLYMYKNSLALQYLNRYYRLRDPTDLETSLRLGEDVVALIPSENSANTSFWQVLADAYAEKYNVDHNPADLEHAVSYFRKASQASSGDPSSLWKVADRWARFMEVNRMPGCLEAYQTAYRILPDLFWVGCRILSRHENLVRHDVAGITTRAIASSIEFKDFELAIEFLEQSLSLTFQQLLDLQTDLSELDEEFPEEASMLRTISAKLQEISISTESDKELLTIPDHPSQGDRQRELAMEREKLLHKIREKRGFEHFLLPVPFKNLVSAAQCGPVIIVNCSDQKCDALVLKPDGHVIHVVLRDVSSKVLLQCQNLRRALLYSGIQSREIDGERGVRNAVLKRESGEKALNDVLAWIWQFIVMPVFKALEENGFRDGRIWWCLTGLLTNLPVHAASPLDCPYIQSYTSTLSALIRARIPPVPKAPVKVFAIGLSEVGAGHRSYLPNVVTEIEALKNAVGDERISVFLNAEATLEKVQELLRRSTWLHLACHGQQGNVRNPLESGLLLYNDKKLELRQLISTPIPGAEFVFLSACETAMGDTDMSNEALHLAGGMIFAGFKAAAGTLWAISDTDAPVIAKAVYSHLFRDGREPSVTDTSQALHLAVKGLRETGVPPHRWVPFIHIGI